MLGNVERSEFQTADHGHPSGQNHLNGISECGLSGEGLSIHRSLRHGLLILGNVTSHRFLNDILFNFLRDDSRELVC